MLLPKYHFTHLYSRNFTMKCILTTNPGINKVFSIYTVTSNSVLLIPY